MGLDPAHPCPHTGLHEEHEIICQIGRDMLNLDDQALGTLPSDKVRPPKSSLDEAMEELS